MTTTEFKNEFELGYDAGSQGAPSLDNYEISVVLTQAQEQIVKSTYSGKNIDGTPFENSEKNRRILNELVKNYTQSTQAVSDGISSDSVFYSIPDSFFILMEQGTIEGTTKLINITPITHDEYLKSKKNPFRKPNKRKAWRLDISKTGGTNLVEIISSEKLSKYQMRYLTKPKPIVISNLTTGEFAGLGLSIDGETTPATCLLNNLIHREILGRAIEIAIRNFRENSLKAQIGTNSR